MQIRKLVKSGQSSYTIALPKDWLDKNKLERGDEVFIEETLNNELVITTSLKSDSEDKQTIVIDVDKKPFHAIWRDIYTAYLDNYSEIIVKGKDIAQYMPNIKKQIYDLVALEVIDESSEKVVAKSFLNLTETSLEKITRRIDNIIRSMFTDTAKALTDDISTDLIISRDHDVNRLGYLIFKMLRIALKKPEVAKILKLSNIEMLVLWELNMHLEKIGDELKRIVRVAPNFRGKGGEKLQKLINEVDELYRHLMKAYYTDHKLDADIVCVSRPDIVKKLDKFFDANQSLESSEFTGKLKAILSHLQDISRLTRFVK